jgi:phosphatidylglycerophosphate synthase
VGVPSLGKYVRRDFAVRSPLISWLVFERLGGAGAYLCARAGVSPAAVTVAGCLTGITGALLLALASEPLHALVAGLVLLFSYTLDCVDGQLARSTGRTSERGAWLDVVADAVVVAFVTVALTYALLLNGAGPLSALLIGGAYGASRTASLLTASIVIRNSTGMRVDGTWGLLRKAYVATTDTPVTYLAFCLARLWPDGLVAVIIVAAILTSVQTAVSAGHFFRQRPSDRIPTTATKVTP